MCEPIQEGQGEAEGSAATPDSQVAVMGTIYQGYIGDVTSMMGTQTNTTDNNN